MEKKFEWTDELVSEFSEAYRDHMAQYEGTVMRGLDWDKIRWDRIYKFKAENSPHNYPEGIVSFQRTNHAVFDDRRMPSESYQECVARNIVVCGYTIHSVKNASGEVLTVGDETNEGKILSFSIMTAIGNTDYTVIPGLFCLTKTGLGNINIDYVHPKKAEYSPKKYPEGILRVSFGSMHWDFRDNHVFEYQEWCKRHLEQDKKITMVKNSSDEFLTVGDETNFGKIHCFKIYEDKILVGVLDLPSSKLHNGIGVAQNMNDVHLKRRGYKTEDGFDLHEGFWAVGVYDFSMAFYETIPVMFFKAEHILFHHRKNAEKYIEDNKPRFSKRQIMDSIIPIEDTNCLLIHRKSLGL